MLRRLQVVFCPYLPQSSCAFLVQQSGLRSLASAEVQQGLAWAADLAQRRDEAEQLRERRLQDQEQRQAEREEARRRHPGELSVECLLKKH